MTWKPLTKSRRGKESTSSMRDASLQRAHTQYPTTPHITCEVVRPEHVIPKAQGHLMGRALSQEQPCTKQSPRCRHQERGIFEDQEWWEEQGCWGWGRSVSQSQSFAANCQMEWSAHAPHVLVQSVNALMGCTQTWWQERVKYELNRRKPSATGISVSFKAVSVLRAAWALEGHSTCSFWSPSYHPTSLAQTAEQHLVTNT